MPSVPGHRASIYYEVFGEGPVVVFAHGVAGNTLSWYQQVPEFSRRYRVVTFDHRGWGRSFCDPSYLHAAYFVEDLRAILDAEGIERASLVGHSLGCWTSLRAAIDYPDRVASLVMVGDSGGILTQKIVEEIRSAASRLARGEAWWEGLVAEDFRKQHPARALLHDHIRSLNMPLDPVKVGQTLEVQVRAEELTGYRIPTLLVTGARDRQTRPELVREAAAIIPDLETHSFEGAGNSPHFETPEEFNRVLLAFLERHAASPSA